MYPTSTINYKLDYTLMKSRLFSLSIIVIFCFQLSGQKNAVEFGQTEVKRGEYALFFSKGSSDFYRSSDDKYSPIGSSAQSAWMAGLSLRSGKKWYEVRVDLYYASQGGRELFNTPVDGIVESDISLKYLGIRAQPLNIRLQKDKYYFHIGIGGYGTILINESLQVNNRTFRGEGFDYELTPYDYGLSFSTGIGYGMFNLVGNFQVGLQPIESQTSQVKNHLLTLGLNIWL